MFRAEQFHQSHPRRVLQQIDRGLPLPVLTRVIRDQTNAQPAQRCEILPLQHIDSIQRDGRLARGQRPRNMTEIKVRDRLRRQRPQLRAQGNDTARFRRMIPIGEEYHERLGNGINP